MGGQSALDGDELLGRVALEADEEQSGVLLAELVDPVVERVAPAEQADPAVGGGRRFADVRADRDRRLAVSSSASRSTVSNSCCEPSGAPLYFMPADRQLLLVQRRSVPRPRAGCGCGARPCRSRRRIHVGPSDPTHTCSRIAASSLVWMLLVPSLYPIRLRGVSWCRDVDEVRPNPTCVHRSAATPRASRARLCTAWNATSGSSAHAWTTRSPPLRAGSSSSPANDGSSTSGCGAQRLETVPVLPAAREEARPEPEGQRQPGRPDPIVSPVSTGGARRSASRVATGRPAVSSTAAAVQLRSSSATSCRRSVTRSKAATLRWSCGAVAIPAWWAPVERHHVGLDRLGRRRPAAAFDRGPGHAHRQAESARSGQEGPPAEAAPSARCVAAHPPTGAGERSRHLRVGVSRGIDGRRPAAAARRRDRRRGREPRRRPQSRRAAARLRPAGTTRSAASARPGDAAVPPIDVSTAWLPSTTPRVVDEPEVSGRLGLGRPARRDDDRRARGRPPPPSRRRRGASSRSGQRGRSTSATSAAAAAGGPGSAPDNRARRRCGAGRGRPATRSGSIAASRSTTPGGKASPKLRAAAFTRL